MGGKRLVDPDHAMHCLLTRMLRRAGSETLSPDNASRLGSTGVLYGYGLSDAYALRESAAVCADPLQSRVMPTDKLNSKPMPTLWKVGQQLGFETRIRPVVRRSQKRRHSPNQGVRRLPLGGRQAS